MKTTLEPRAVSSPFVKGWFLSFFIFLWAVNAGFAAGENKQYLASIPADVFISSRDGKGVVESLEANIKGLNDYVFESKLVSYKTAKPEASSGRLYYKKDKLLRIEVTDSSYKGGSVVVRQSDGSIKAKGGLKLGFVHMSLSEDSRLLALPNGFNVIKSDYISLVTNLRTYLNNGTKTRATASPVSVSGFSEKVHVLEVLNQDQSVKERIFISISHGVPVQWDIFSNGKLFSSVSFTNYKPNQGFRDEIFKL